MENFHKNQGNAISYFSFTPFAGNLIEIIKSYMNNYKQDKFEDDIIL